MATTKEELKNHLNSGLDSILATLNESLNDIPDGDEQPFRLTLTMTGTEAVRAQVRLCRCRGVDDDNFRWRPCDQCKS